MSVFDSVVISVAKTNLCLAQYPIWNLHSASTKSLSILFGIIFITSQLNQYKANHTLHSIFFFDRMIVFCIQCIFRHLKCNICSVYSLCTQLSIHLASWIFRICLARVVLGLQFYYFCQILPVFTSMCTVELILLYGIFCNSSCYHLCLISH